MTITLHRDLNGQHAAHVHDGKRLRHITAPGTPAEARAAAKRWIASAGKVLNGGGQGKSGDVFLKSV